MFNSIWCGCRDPIGLDVAAVLVFEHIFGSKESVSRTKSFTFESLDVLTLYEELIRSGGEE